MAGMLAKLVCCCLLPITVVLGADRALVVDYEMNPPDFSNEVIRRVAATGLAVDFRQYYPQLTQTDLREHRMIVLEASAGGIGSNLQLTEAEVPALVRWVRGGGLLVVGVPQDAEAWPQLDVYNRLLAGTGIRVLPAIADDQPQYFGSMFPHGYLQGERLVLDRCTLLEVSGAAQVMARTSPTAFAVEGLGRARVPRFTSSGGFPVAALAAVGKGFVFVTGRFNLNIGGFNGRVGVQPTNSLEWIPASERFMRNVFAEMVRRGTADPRGTETAELPVAAPAGARVIVVDAGGSVDPAPVDRARYRASIRRDVFGPYLDHGMRAAWGSVDLDDARLTRLAAGFKDAGLNYIWGVGWPKVGHSWETFAKALDGSGTGWSIGINYPGAGFDKKRYARSRGLDGKEIEILSPLDLRLWNEMIIPPLEEMARFSLEHPSVKGVTIDFEMYGYEPIIFYPEGVGFEDVAYCAFLRGAEGHVDAGLLTEAASLGPAQRWPWLRDHGLLDMYFLILEGESEKLGRVMRERVHAINPKFILGAYQAGLPYSWFYRGLLRGMSTPEMPMLWMSFQGLSARDVDRFWGRGQHMLNAAALMLGLHPVAEWDKAMLAGRKYHDGYWLNRYNWLVDDAAGRKSIEIPEGTHEESWASLRAGNRALDEWESQGAQHRVLKLADGRDFFPIGLYGFPDDRSDEGMYREAGEAGFNFVVGREARAGFVRSYDLPGGPPDADAATRRGSLLDLSRQGDRKRAELSALVQSAEKTPGLVVWQGPDEPNYFPFGVKAGPPADGLRAGAEVLRRLSPVPLWINFSPTGDHLRPGDLSALRAYVDIPDVVSFDIYPVGEGAALQESPFADRGLSCVGEFTRALVRLVSENGVQRKPVWMVLQAFGWEHLGKTSNPPEKWTGRPPAYEEIRFMTFDAIINGAGGVVYWGAPFLPKGDGAWPALLKVAAEVKGLQGALTGEWVAAEQYLSLSNRNVEAAVRRAGGVTYVILANASSRAAVGLEMRVGARVERMDFGPWEVKVVRQ
jgi:hypothetical protein